MSEGNNLYLLKGILNKYIISTGIICYIIIFTIFTYLSINYPEISGEDYQLYSSIIVSLLGGIFIVILDKNLNNLKQIIQEGAYLGIFLFIITIFVFIFRIFYSSFTDTNNSILFDNSTLLFVSFFIIFWGIIMVLFSILGSIIASPYRLIFINKTIIN